MQPSRRPDWSILIGTLVLVLLLDPADGLSAGYKELNAKRPDLFHPQTGYRISKQRSPTPDDIPLPSIKITTTKAVELLKYGAIPIDVFGASQSRFDELDGTWLVSKTRKSLPGAVWLPEIGRGTLTKEMRHYLETNLERLTKGDKEKELILFCVADCWMSWNASQRVASLGYKNVFWYRLGTDGWLENGNALEPVNPVPVDVD